MRIEIKNYENLRNFNHIFEKGLTQIKGETNSGKSSLIRAIWDFAHNSATDGEISIFADPKEKMFIKVNEDEFERDKKNKRYLISGIENNKPGREKVIKTIDRTNFQFQQERPFLVGETEGEKYSYIIGEKNDIFIDAITILNKEYASSKKVFDIKNKDLDKKDLEILKLDSEIKELEELGWEEIKEEILNKIAKIKKLEEVKRNKKEIESIKLLKVIDTKQLVSKGYKIKLMLKLKEIEKEMKEIKLLKIIDTTTLKVKLEKSKSLERLRQIRRDKGMIVFKTTINKDVIVNKFKNCLKETKIIKNNKELDLIKPNKIVDVRELKEKIAKATKINKLSENKKTKSKILLAPETDVNILKEKFMSLKNIMKKLSELNANINVIKNLKEKIVEKEEEINNNSIKLKELRGEMKECPLCGTHL